MFIMTEDFKEQNEFLDKLILVSLDTVKKIIMEKLIEDYFRCLNSIGWEREIKIAKNGAFDLLTNGISYVDKTDYGFYIQGYRFVY